MNLGPAAIEEIRVMSFEQEISQNHVRKMIRLCSVQNLKIIIQMNLLDALYFSEFNIRLDSVYCNRVRDIRKHTEQNGLAIIIQIWTKINIHYAKIQLD